ncbi:conserved hypothetical protein, partial [Leishmania mexicana MHOM/GT/2001/U1103]|jgi:hypothetical protein
MSTS